MDRSVGKLSIPKSAIALASALSLACLPLMGCAFADGMFKSSAAETAPNATPTTTETPAVPADMTAAPAEKPAAAPKPASKKTAKKNTEKPSETASTPPANKLEAKAQQYERFRRDLDAIAKMEFKTPKDVKAAYNRLLKYQPEEISAGWMAYSAEVVARNDAFSKAVREDVAAHGRDAVLRKITADWKYVSRLPGAYSAIDDLMTEVADDTSKLSKLGDRLIDTAYAFQKERWGFLDVPGPHYAQAGARLQVMPASFFGNLFDDNGSSKKMDGAATGATYRILMLAASINAGAAPDNNATLSLAQDQGLNQCLRWARLNLNQCLAAAHFPSENAYCTGKHGINEMSACWTKLLPTKS